MSLVASVVSLFFAACDVPQMLDVGSPVSKFLSPATDGVLVVWGVQPEDCLVCQDVTRRFRMLQGSVADDVELLLVVLGDDSGLIDSFLRVERVDAKVLHFNASEFKDRFGGIEVPFLAVANDSSIVQLWTGRAEIARAVQGADSPMVAAVERLLRKVLAK